MQLKEEFFYRLILDESTSFGVVGATGRGVTEHYGIEISEVEVLTMSLDTTLCSVGGLCVGTHEIVDHQRLSGAGYCFSAAAPPFLASAAMAALNRLDENGPALMADLNKNALRMKTALRKIKNFQVASDFLAEQVEGTENNDADWNSPIMYLSLIPSPDRTWEEDEALIHELCEMCVVRGVGVTTLKINTEWLATLNKELVRPSLRICASTLLKVKEITYAIGVIKDCAKAIKLRQ
jgi:serine palmitoyltransferase